MAYSRIQSGVRWAETTRHSCGTPNCVSISSAWLIVSQSDLLPMMMPTSGAGSWAMGLQRVDGMRGVSDYGKIVV